MSREKPGLERETRASPAWRKPLSTGHRKRGQEEKRSKDAALHSTRERSAGEEGCSQDREQTARRGSSESQRKCFQEEKGYRLKEGVEQSSEITEFIYLLKITAFRNMETPGERTQLFW